MFPIIMLSQHPDASVQSCQTPKMCNYQLEMIMYKMPYAAVFIPTEPRGRAERYVRGDVNGPSVERNEHEDVEKPTPGCFSPFKNGILPGS